ncbi:MAG: nitronate monooxygenase [Dehalococcoidia bacterium]|nr:nitronate monooxygenase [Dehalococcoidia bacterium]
MKKTDLCRLLGIEYPIIQAPMAYITWSEMVAAVSNAGGLGTLGPNAGSREPAPDVAEVGRRLRDQIRKVKALTNKPFAVNFVIYEGVSAVYADTGKSPNDFSEECVRVALEEGIPVAILVGKTPETYAGRFKEAGVKVLLHGHPCNVEAARHAQQVGVDAFVAVGYGAGGHSGIDQIPTFVLVPEIVDAVDIPVIAGGGIADGRGLAAALALGAQAVYMGTRFIATKECNAHPRLKQAVLEATDTSTVSWLGSFGVVRGLKNNMAARCLEMEAKGANSLEISSVYGGAAVRAGFLNGDIEEGSVIFGAAAGLIKDIPSAGEVVTRTVQEADETLAKLVK